MKTRLETTDRSQIEWKEVEEERSVGFGGQRDHLALLLLVGPLEDVLKIGSLPA